MVSKLCVHIGGRCKCSSFINAEDNNLILTGCFLACGEYISVRFVSLCADGYVNAIFRAEWLWLSIQREETPLTGWCGDEWRWRGFFKIFLFLGCCSDSRLLWVIGRQIQIAACLISSSNDDIYWCFNTSIEESQILGDLFQRWEAKETS